MLLVCHSPKLPTSKEFLALVFLLVMAMRIETLMLGLVNRPPFRHSGGQMCACAMKVHRKDHVDALYSGVWQGALDGGAFSCSGWGRAMVWGSVLILPHTVLSLCWRPQAEQKRGI